MRRRSIFDRPFVLEEWWSRYHQDAVHKLGSSGCSEISVRQVLALSGQEGESILGHVLVDTDPAGCSELRKRIAALYADRTPSQVVVTHGGSEAIFLALSLFAGNRKIVVVRPVYESIAAVAEEVSSTVLYHDLDPARGWRLDLDRLLDAIDENTGVVFVNFPNNPTGSVLKDDELLVLARHCEKLGCRLVSDEVFSDLTYVPGDVFRSACDLSGSAVAIGSMTKSFGLPGLRIGWIVCDECSIMKLRRLKSYTTLAEASLSEYLALCSLDAREQIYALQRSRFRTNLDQLGLLAERFDLAPPSAGVCCFPRPCRMDVDESVRFQERLIRRHGVFVVPGSAFGYPAHFRLGFGCESGAFRAGLQVLLQALDSET